MKILAEGSNRLQKVEKLRGGVLYFDLVKFTNLTVLLAESGPRGAEKLHELMTAYYDLLIQIIHKYGGAVYQFAGDSAIVAFEENAANEGELPLIVCACAQEMRESLINSQLEYKGYKFSARYCVSLGDYRQVLLGNNSMYFQAALLGNAINDVVNAASLAGANEIVLSGQAGQAVQNHADLSPAGDFSGNFYKLEKLNKSVDILPPSAGTTFENNPSLLKKCAKFMPPALAKKIASTKTGYFGEFRDVTSVFIRVDGIDFSRESESVRNLDLAYAHICELCEVFGGILIQSDFTDKGCVFFVLFGAPVALEKKEDLAVRFSLRLLESLKKFSFVRNLNIGIAGGPMYCGDVGSPARKGYSVMGEPVNLASRLMEYASDGFPALDQKTARALTASFQIEQKSEIELKGIRVKQIVYAVFGENEERKSTAGGDIFVGRKKEREVFSNILAENTSGGFFCGVIGEAGVGKSRLTGEFIAQARGEKYEIFEGICYSYEKFTPFFPWKNILSALFQIPLDAAVLQAIELIENALKSLENPESQKKVINAWARVLYRILGGAVDEISYTLNMDPRKKNEQIFNIIGDLLKKQSLRSKTLLLFEDYHWIDENSENLVRHCSSLEIPGLLILTVSRPEGKILNIESQKNMKLIELSEFSPEDAKIYLKLKLNLLYESEKSDKLESEILAKGHGNPFFLESIVYSLREQKVLLPAADEKYVLSGEAVQLEIPDSLQGVLLSRIDRLGEFEKLVLKNASVIGRLFSLNLLKAVAVDDQDSDLILHLEQLEDGDFTILELKEPLTYIFKHVLIRDVAYHSLLSATREILHNRVANYLENLGDDKIEENIDLLAYHFYNANNFEKTLKYSLLAAQKAVSIFSLADAVHHYGVALKILENKPDYKDLYYDIKIKLGHVYRNGGQFDEALENFKDALNHVKDREKLARCHTGLGMVYQEKGNTAPASKELEATLKFLGTSAPQSSRMATLKSARQLLNRVLWGIFPFLPIQAKGRHAKILEMRFEVIEFLAKLYYFNNVEKFGWANLMQVNISEKIDNNRFKGRAYASLGLVYAALGFFSLADKNIRKSKIYALKANDPLTEAISLQRCATIEMYRNVPQTWYEKLKASAPLHEKFGETWEKILTIGAMNVPLMYQGKFREARQNNELVLKLSFSEKIKQFQCWGLLTKGIVDYMLMEEETQKCVDSLIRAQEIANDGGDTAGYTSATRYLLIILILENNSELALKNAREALVRLKRMTSIIPHCHSTYYQIILSIEMAERDGLIDRRESEKIRKEALKRLQKLGKTYKYIYGFSLRATARRLAQAGKPNAAAAAIERAVSWYDTTLNMWDKTRACYEAALLVPGKKEEYIQKGIEICRQNGYARDLKDFQKLLLNKT